MKKIVFLSILIASLVACNSKTVLPNVSGAANELLVVTDESIWRSEAGRALFDVLTTEVPCLPQAEPMFSISRLPHSQFDALLHTTRNIVFLTIDSTQYTRATLRFSHDRWASTQALATITSDNVEHAAALIGRQHQTLLDFFVKAERERQISYLKKNINAEALNRIHRKFGIKMAVPTSLNKYKEADNFLWISNGSATGRQDIVVYSRPYVSKNQLTLSSLIAARDSILCQHIPGSFEGSCIGTATHAAEPVFEQLWVNDDYSAQIHGLWEMKNGETMGGPFFSCTRLDEINNRLITVEGFVFAPGKEKRNLMRQMEAMVLSVQMPHEENAVVVTAK